MSFNSTLRFTARRAAVSLHRPEDNHSTILVDPYPLWLDELEHVLAAVPINVVAKSSSLAEASALIERLRPDLAVAEIAVDVDEDYGVAWLRRTVDRFPTKVVVLTACLDPEYTNATLAAGASASVLKTAHPDDLVATVRQTFSHSIYLARTQCAEPADRPAPLPMPHELTRRELEILRLAAEGHSNARLAQMLWVTEQTVKFHLSNIYRKIGVANRTEASRWAQVHGLLPPDSVPNQVA